VAQPGEMIEMPKGWTPNLVPADDFRCHKPEFECANWLLLKIFVCALVLNFLVGICWPVVFGERGVSECTCTSDQTTANIVCIESRR